MEKNKSLQRGLLCLSPYIQPIGYAYQDSNLKLALPKFALQYSLQSFHYCYLPKFDNSGLILSSQYIQSEVLL